MRFSRQDQPHPRSHDRDRGWARGYPRLGTVAALDIHRIACALQLADANIAPANTEAGMKALLGAA